MGEDPIAILHALGIVILAGMAFGLGLTGLSVQDSDVPFDTARLADRLLGLWLSVITMMVGWIIWVLLAYLLGSRVMRGQASYRQVLRAIGICYGPAVLVSLISVPYVGDAAPVFGVFWVLVAGVAAMREVQKVDWLTALLATGPGWILSFFVLPVAFLQQLFG